jgi:hypothetical protein
MRTTSLFAGIIVVGILVGRSYAQSEGSLARQLVGTWRLVSTTQRDTDGSTRVIKGHGYLIYTDTGHMCAVLTPPDRPKWKIARPNGQTTDPAEALSAITGSDAYCSRVEINARGGNVQHHVEVSVRPNLVGVIRRRSFTFDGPNRVILKVDPAELPPPRAEVALTWERVQK